MTSDPGTILRRLAAVVAAGPDALWAALHEHAPGWVPTPDDPGRPNREYTRTRESRWRLAAVLAGRILARRPVTAAELLAAAELWPEAADNGEQVRRGRMPKQEQREKKARLLALAKEHRGLVDDPGTLAGMVGTSESTVRRWLGELREEWAESLRRRREDNDEE